jgi:hypothetical protein
MVIILRWIWQREFTHLWKNLRKSIPDSIILFSPNSTGARFARALWAQESHNTPVLCCDLAVWNNTWKAFKPQLLSHHTFLNFYNRFSQTVRVTYGRNVNRKIRQKVTWVGNIGAATRDINIYASFHRAKAIYFSWNKVSASTEIVSWRKLNSCKLKSFLRRRAKFYRDCSWKEDWTIMVVSGK